MGSRIGRRGFVSGLVGAGAAAAFPTSVLGQRQRTPVIGFLNSLSKSGWLDYLAAFHSGLRETGFLEGQNVKFVYRWAEGRYDQLPALAAELTQQHVDLIAATGGNPATLAAKAATSDIPVVFIVAGDPVKVGLVASLNRPGGNMTGVSIITTSLEAKRLELLHELVPQADLIAVLLNPEFPEAEAELKVAQTAAEKLGTRLLIIKAVDESDLEAAFGTAVNARANAFLIASDPNYYALRHKLISLAAQHRFPRSISFEILRWQVA